MFMPNDVYTYGTRRIRVLWSNPDVIFWIDIDDKKALPQLASNEDFEHLIAKNEMKSIIDPHINIVMTFPSKNSKAEGVQESA